MNTYLFVDPKSILDKLPAVRKVSDEDDQVTSCHGVAVHCPSCGHEAARLVRGTEAKQRVREVKGPTLPKVYVVATGKVTILGPDGLPIA